MPLRGPAGPVLLVLGLTVLGAHLVLLAGIGGVTPALQPAPAASLQTLQTRLITPPAPPAPQAVATPPAAGKPTALRPPTARLLTPSDTEGQGVAPQPPAPPPPETGEDEVRVAAEAQTAADAAADTAASEALAVETQTVQAEGRTDPAPDPAIAPLPTASVAAQEEPAAAVEDLPGAAVAQNDPPKATENAAAASAIATATATGALPGAALQVDPVHLPPSLALHYDMTGQDRGLTYHATGELRWQRNAERYALSLVVRALLLGSREWRSQGLIGPQGLQPLRFSDKRRTERATHFDREGGRVVFSGSAAPVPLAPGAQDQISLYVQLAAAIGSASGPMPAGTRLQVQTATTRDALPWLLTLERYETLRIDDHPVESAYWLCLPRQRFDARIELWTAVQHHQLPVRIRITQANGSFIDLQLRRQEALPSLPPGTPVGMNTTSP